MRINWSSARIVPNKYETSRSRFPAHQQWRTLRALNKYVPDSMFVAGKLSCTISWVMSRSRCVCDCIDRFIYWLTGSCWLSCVVYPTPHSHVHIGESDWHWHSTSENHNNDTAEWCNMAIIGMSSPAPSPWGTRWVSQVSRIGLVRYKAILMARIEEGAKLWIKSGWNLFHKLLVMIDGNIV